MIPFCQNLLNSGSKSMSVNGSVGGGGSKSFLFTATQTTAVTGIAAIMKDDGATTFSKFGAITALSTGILIRMTIGGVTTDVTTIKDNSEMCSRFHFNQFGNGAVLSVLGISTAQGFGDTNDAFIGFMEFPKDLYPILNTDDTVEVLVRDDLTNIDLLEMAVKGCVQG